MEAKYEIPPGERARIVRISENKQAFLLRYWDGRVSTASSGNPITFELGADVIVWTSEDAQMHIDVLPDELLTPDLEIGIVKLVTDAAIVVEIGSRLRRVNSQIEILKGATVEVDPVLGIVSQISATPIQVIDFADEASRVADFIVDSSSNDSEQLSYDDFAGFEDIVEEARELIELSLDVERRLQAIGGKPIKGLLFTGDPGSGKTFLARIISRQMGATFYQVKGPEVMGRWVGQSEEVLRALFEHASKHTPAIIFFDEIDSLASRRGGDSSESSQRVVAQLLTLMDGFHQTDGLLVIAATNLIDQIDPALRRPGRFDREINFRYPNIVDRKAILELGASRHHHNSDVPDEELLTATDGWSSAEVSALWNEATFLAAADGRERIRRFDLLGAKDRLQRAHDARNSVPA